MINKWAVLGVVILLGCLGCVASADLNSQQGGLVWQKEFSYEGLSCFPQLINVTNHGKIIIVGTAFNQRDRDVTGRIWEWVLDGGTGERLSDITIVSARRVDCRGIDSFWITKGLDIAEGSEIQLFVDPMERGAKQGLIKSKDGQVVQSFEITAQGSKKGIFAGRMKRFNSKEYFLFGSGRKEPSGVLQKRNNNNDLIWEQQYSYENWCCITDIARSKSGDLLAITGWTRDKNHKSVSTWINIIADDGTVVAKEEFSNSNDLIRVPQLEILDNNNIAVVYCTAINEQVTDIKYRIYSKSLKLKLNASIYTDKINFLYYGSTVIDGGFVIAHNVLEKNGQYTMLNQYDCEGKKIKGMKIDGIGVLADQVVIGSKGKMVYLASLKKPLPPVHSAVTAIKLDD